MIFRCIGSGQLLFAFGIAGPGLRRGVACNLPNSYQMVINAPSGMIYHKKKF